MILPVFLKEKCSAFDGKSKKIPEKAIKNNDEKNKIPLDFFTFICYNRKKCAGREVVFTYMPTFEQIITAEFDFTAIKDLIFKIYTHPTVDGLLVHFRNFIESLPPFAWAIMLGLVGLIFSNFGKKLLAIPSVLLSAAAGFLVGNFVLAPLLISLLDKVEFLKEFISIDPIVVGIICAAIFAVLFLPLYFCGYVVGIGYCIYLLVYPLCAALFGAEVAMIIGLGAAVGVVILALIFRKWVEMCGTAIVGAYFVMLAINQIVLLYAVVNYIIWAVFAVQGAVIQIKTRRRY